MPYEELKETKTIAINIERYNELIKAEQKAIQYRKFLLENTNNNQLTKGIVAIESKSFYELLQENRESSK